MAGTASFQLLVGVLVTMGATGTMVTAIPAAATKEVLEFCNAMAALPQIPTCLQKLGIKTERPDELFHSNDDKCLSKCIIIELKEMDENGQTDMAVIESNTKAMVPSVLVAQSLADTKACLQSTDKPTEILKQSGVEKSVAVCKYALSLMKCHMANRDKLCEGIGN